MNDRHDDDSSGEAAGGMSHEDALRECERRDARAKFIEHVAVEVRSGVWKISSRLRPDWRRFSTSDRLDRPVKKGERFVARGDVEVAVMTHWRAPFTGGQNAILPAGTIVVATDDQRLDAPGFNCVPEDYERLETILVPETDRGNGKYGGYSLSFLLDDIGVKIDPLG
jgi:hypothetical protein